MIIILKILIHSHRLGKKKNQQSKSTALSLLRLLCFPLVRVSQKPLEAQQVTFTKQKFYSNRFFFLLLLLLLLPQLRAYDFSVKFPWWRAVAAAAIMWITEKRLVFRVYTVAPSSLMPLCLACCCCHASYSHSLLSRSSCRIVRVLRVYVYAFVRMCRCDCVADEWVRALVP